MPTDVLFKKLCDPSTIEIGWHLAHGDSRDDFATDPLAYADYAFLKKERFHLSSSNSVIIGIESAGSPISTFQKLV